MIRKFLLILIVFTFPFLLHAECNFEDFNQSLNIGYALHWFEKEDDFRGQLLDEIDDSYQYVNGLHVGFDAMCKDYGLQYEYQRMYQQTIYKDDDLSLKREVILTHYILNYLYPVGGQSETQINLVFGVGLLEYESRFTWILTGENQENEDTSQIRKGYLANVGIQYKSLINDSFGVFLEPKYVYSMVDSDMNLETSGLNFGVGIFFQF